MAEVVAQGVEALPPGALPAAAAAACFGVALSVLAGRQSRPYVPSAFAMGIGALVPFGYSLAIAAGAAVLVAGKRLGGESWAQRAPVAGAGLIAGESLVGLLAALLTSFGRL
jgi:uncharacterized oligopeptide transporter (OPT) family protein